MTTHEGLPVAGYRPQTSVAVETVNIHKDMEERLLRHMDLLKVDPDIDQHWLAIGRTHLELGWMAINRSVFRPSRVELPSGPDAT